MLVLSRKKDEAVIIGEQTIVTVVEIRGDKVRLGFDAPPSVPVHRQEVAHAIQRATGRTTIPSKPMSAVEELNTAKRLLQAVSDGFGDGVGSIELGIEIDAFLLRNK